MNYCLVYFLAFAFATFTSIAKAEDSIVLGFTSDFVAGEYHPPIIDSKYGYVPVFNLALSQAIDLCSNVDSSIAASIRLAPNRFTTLTTKAIETLSLCRHELNITNNASVSLSLYRRLTGQTIAPSVLQRIKVLIFRDSPLTPDYDRTFWNPQSASIFTWGPFRATGCTLQSLMKQLLTDESTKGAVQAAFAEDADFLARLIKTARCDSAKYKKLFKQQIQSPERRQQLELSFAHLAQSPEVRQLYDDFFYGQKGKLTNGIVNYIKVWTDAGLQVSEIDFGFFMERSLQYPTLKSAELTKLGKLFHRNKKLSNLMARKIVSHEFNFNAFKAREYQTGRDAQFFVDVTGRPNMDANEKAAWMKHSGILASDLGLTDKPYDYCRDILLPNCLRKESPHD